MKNNKELHRQYIKPFVSSNWISCFPLKCHIIEVKWLVSASLIGSDQIFHSVSSDIMQSQGDDSDSKAGFLWFSHLCLVNHMQWFFVCVRECLQGCAGSLLWWFCLQSLMAYNPFVCRLHCVDVLAGLLIAWIAHPRTDEWMSVRGYCELWKVASILTSSRTRLGHNCLCLSDTMTARRSDVNRHIVYFFWWCDAQW